MYRRRPETWATTPTASQAHTQPDATPFTNASDDSTTSALTNLLSKLGDSSLQPAVTPPYPQRAASASVPPPSTGIPLLDTIFASATFDNWKNEISPAPNGLPSPFTNVNGRTGNYSSSSSAATPTQQSTQLPRPSPPVRNRQTLSKSHSGPLIIGAGVLPHPKYIGGNTSQHSTHSSPSPQPNGHSKKSRAPYYLHLTKTQEEEESAFHQLAMAVNGTSSPTRQSRSKNIKHEKSEMNGVARLPEDAVDWPLVDDRSISMDDDHEETKSSLGDGLVDVIAALSESDHHNVNGSSPPLKKGKNKDRRRRKNKEEKLALQSTDPFGQASSSPSPRPTDVADVLMDVYGRRRRRVGDPVLKQDDLKEEVLELINVCGLHTLFGMPFLMQFAERSNFYAGAV